MSTSKRVRFAADLERTPSPTFSNSSAPSSPLLRTPPTYASHPELASPPGPYLASPYGRQRGHARTPSPLSLNQIHAIVCSSSFDNPARVVPFTWDVTVEPHFARASHPSHPQSPMQYALSEDVLALPAVLPYTKAITIKCRQLPWKIDVIAANGAWVTVQDVLHQVYRNLRTPMKQHEYRDVVASDRHKEEEITRAYEARYRAISNDSAREQEKAKGLKRVDVLTKSVIFSGLSLGDRPNEYMLNLRSR